MGVVVSGTTNDFSAHSAASFHARLAEAARVLSQPSPQLQTVQQVADLAVATIDECESASASVCIEDAHSHAWSDHSSGRCTTLQYDLQQGPHFELAEDAPVVVSGDLSADTRWPQWSAQAWSEFGMRSVMSIRLSTETTHFGAITLFSRSRDAFAPEPQTGVVAFAAIASAALQAARTREQLESSLESRAIIGQAQGVIMERFHVDAREAFDMLKRVSQQANLRLREFADETVCTRDHPDISTRTRPWSR